MFLNIVKSRIESATTYTGRFLMRQNWVAKVQCLLGVLKVCESYPRFVTTVCVEIARKFDALS